MIDCFVKSIVVYCKKRKNNRNFAIPNPKNEQEILWDYLSEILLDIYCL
jgi:hypothetical protein